MGTLGSKKIKDTYKDLLKLANETDNTGITSSLVAVEDGNGTDSALQISTTGVKSTGTLEVTGNTTFDTNTLFVDATNNMVGIGTTSPGAKLEVNGFTSGQGLWVNYGNSSGQIEAITLRSNGGASGRIGLQMVDASNADLWLGGSGGRAMTIYRSGKVGIGTDSPEFQLELSTDSAAKPGGGSWATTSDLRIKKDIVDADLQRCLEIVKSIPLKHYGYKDGVYLDKSINDKSQLGWIAQEVESVFPKAVMQNKFEYQEKIESTTEVEDYEEKDEVSGEMIKKTRPKLIPKETIEDCRSLNADQIYKAMFGALQLLIQKVEALENK